MGQEAHAVYMWETILSAPFFCRLDVAVLDDEGMHPLVFPCERTVHGWKHAITGTPLTVHPTHWRYWIEHSPGQTGKRNG
jgi:hypothetical protein